MHPCPGLTLTLAVPLPSGSPGPGTSAAPVRVAVKGRPPLHSPSAFGAAKAGLANTMAQINVSADMRPNLANLTSIHLRGVSRLAYCEVRGSKERHFAISFLRTISSSTLCSALTDHLLTRREIMTNESDRFYGDPDNVRKVELLHENPSREHVRVTVKYVRGPMKVFTVDRPVPLEYATEESPIKRI